MRFVCVLVAALALATACGTHVAQAGEARIENGAFALQSEGVPESWAVSEGATSGNLTTRTKIEGVRDGGIALSGDAETAHWLMLSQRFAAEAGDDVELRFTARAAGLRLERGQFGSCYVGLVHRDAAGTPIGFAVEDVRNETWREARVFARIPATAASTEVALFLSMTGRLEVRTVAVRKLEPAESYAVLVADMDRHYSFFAPHGIDWQALSRTHAAAGRAAATPQAFAAALHPLLAALRDPHVWIDVPGVGRRQPWAPTVVPNFEIGQVLRRLASHTQVIGNVLAGRTRDGYGYLALGTMQGTPAQLEAVDAAWRGLFDAPAIILDLRVNGGGRESWGQRLCGCLARTRLLYARSRIRAGPRHEDLTPGGERWLVPRPDALYRKPVVALVGPACISSGEGMALMLKALPDVALLGLPTRGASGNPQVLHLPNGVSVWYSRWISLLPDGSPLERKGVPPDIRVEHVPGGDATFDRAAQLLRTRLATAARERK